MSASSPVTLPQALQPIHAAMRHIAPDAVLVGGAVRDLLLGRAIKDLDYAVPAQGLHITRRLANAIGGAYYPLDEARDTGRVIWQDGDGTSLVIDVAVYRGPDLGADLAARDYTINAIALRSDGVIIDPMGGVADLAQRRLRTCAPDSLRSDPLRILRGVRMLLTFGLQVAPELAAQVAEALPGLAKISRERQRDEILALLALPDPVAAFGQMAGWGLLPHLFPELEALAGIKQPAPHVHDVYEHTLATLRWMARIDLLLRQALAPADAVETALMAALMPFQPALAEMLVADLAPGRACWKWLRFAALAHDWGKAATGGVTDDGRIHFLGHESVSAQLAGAWLERFVAATAEIRFVIEICQAHMRPHHLHDTDAQPSVRSLHRLYRDLGRVGVLAVTLLHLADVLATYGNLSAAVWQERLAFAIALITPALASAGPAILPKPLLNGREVMAVRQIASGPAVGRLLAALQEAQAVGEVTDRAQALVFVQNWPLESA